MIFFFGTHYLDQGELAWNDPDNVSEFCIKTPWPLFCELRSYIILKCSNPEKPTSLLKVKFHVVAWRYSSEREVVKQDETYHENKTLNLNSSLNFCAWVTPHCDLFNGVYI